MMPAGDANVSRMLDVTGAVWLRRSSSHYTGAASEEDLGTSAFSRWTEAFVAEGDWGAVRISGAQPHFELDG
jgi:hypothetical protein